MDDSSQVDLDALDDQCYDVIKRLLDVHTPTAMVTCCVVGVIRGTMPNVVQTRDKQGGLSITTRMAIKLSPRMLGTVSMVNESVGRRQALPVLRSQEQLTA